MKRRQAVLSTYKRQEQATLVRIANLEHVVIYTDGACIGNPGRGGYGAVLLHDEHRKEISGGYHRTTNNRMELLAVIKALEILKRPCRATVYSDSRYVVDGIMKGWAIRWRSLGWLRKKDRKDMPALNPDLWARLLNLTEKHHVVLKWVRGHDGNIENERADRLAARGTQETLEEDRGFKP